MKLHYVACNRKRSLFVLMYNYNKMILNSISTLCKEGILIKYTWKYVFSVIVTMENNGKGMLETFIMHYAYFVAVSIKIYSLYKLDWFQKWWEDALKSDFEVVYLSKTLLFIREKGINYSTGAIMRAQFELTLTLVHIRFYWSNNFFFLILHFCQF